jgi:hypothetical protein
VPVAGGKDTTDVPLDTFLAALQRHLVERGWVDDAVLHVADEPIPENGESWRALSRRVHAAAPRLKRIEAIQVPDLGRDLEISVVEEKRLDWWYDGYRARQRTGGMELWLYTSWLPQGAYANRLIDYPLLKTRILPWIAARYGATGLLHWGLNQWPQDGDSVDPNKGLFAPGDDFIIYPGRDGPRSSLRWEAFRDGVEDYAQASCRLALPGLIDHISELSEVLARVGVATSGLTKSLKVRFRRHDSHPVGGARLPWRRARARPGNGAPGR